MIRSELKADSVSGSNCGLSLVINWFSAICMLRRASGAKKPDAYTALESLRSYLRACTFAKSSIIGLILGSLNYCFSVSSTKMWNSRYCMCILIISSLF